LIKTDKQRENETVLNSIQKNTLLYLLTVN